MIKINNKFAIGCLIQWYEIEMIGEYLQSVKNSIENIDNKSLVFHAGTKNRNNQVLTNGGRVLAISSFGETLKDSVQKSYETIQEINFDGMYFRKDIGFDLMS